MTVPTPIPLALPQHPHRFRLSRAGIRNVWQYDDARFDFATGRMLLRGKNGAGKSKALEMLLPYLLDGEQRSIDAMGTGRTTLKWLMLDGYTATNRLGYLWVEFERVDEDGEARHLTLGAAVRASNSTKEAKPFFFVTDRRVDHDLTLVENGQPLAIDRLKGQVGASNVTDRAAEHRTRVARDLFGLTDTARYRSLTHLLHRLRRPTVGDRIEAGGLTAVLTEALPPLDEDILTTVAKHLDDLVAIRRDLHDLEELDRALARFLTGYQGYLHGVLRIRTEAVADRLTGLTAGRRAAGDSERKAADLRAEEDHRNGKLTHWRDLSRAATAELRALQESAAYRSLTEIQDRKSRVAAIEDAARSAGDAADTARRAEEAASARLAADLERIAGTVKELAAEHRTLVRAVVQAGLDATATGVAPTTPVETFAPEVAAVDVTPLRAAIEEWAARLDAAGPVVKARLRAVDELDRLLKAAIDAGQAARSAAADVERLDALAETARQRIDRHAAEVEHAGTAFAERVRAWAHPLGEAAAPILALVTAAQDDSLPLEDRTLPAEAHDEVERAARTIVDPLAADLDTHRDRAREAVRAAAGELAALRAEHDAWTRRPDSAPDAGRYRAAVRAPGTGAPLYRLVDFAAHLTESEQAGLEAALEASGLLDGWVAAEGLVLDADTRDVLLAPTATVTGRTLADLLDPVSVPDSGVTVHQVAALLRSVAADEGTSRIAVDGTWRLGVAFGAHTKERAEYVGAEVRAATRRRKLVELGARIADADAEHESRQDVLADLDRRRDELRALLRALPPGRDLHAAWIRLGEAREQARDLAGRLTHARRDADAKRVVEVTRRERAHAHATAHALPVERAELAKLRGLVDRVRHDVEGLRRRALATRDGLGTHLDARDAWRTARRGHARQVSAHEESLLRLAEEQAGLAVLEAALGEDPQAILAREREVSQRLEEARRQIRPAELAVQETHDRAIRAEAERDARKTDLTALEEAVVATGAELRRALALPEVQRGAGLDGAETLIAPEAPGTDVRSRIRALDSLLREIRERLGPPGKDASDTTLLNRYTELQAGLRGGYDAVLTETDGVKLCHITDDHGRHDVALIARRLADQAQDARTRLSEREREVFERYLLGELGDNLTGQVFAAKALITLMNDTLDGVRTSHGLGARLVWKIREDADADTRAAVDLLDGPAALRSRADAENLRVVLQRLIEAERQKDPTAGYALHLRRALDYRDWHTFEVQVLDDARPGGRRTLNARIGLSQGEQRVISYLVLFATAAAHFESVAAGAVQAPRMILLDDAFAKVDEPTHGRLLGLLVRLDLDFVLTSERLWGTFREVPSLHIYECLRDPHHRGVATLHFTWDGSRKRLVGT
ncbi:TIGR02680 family protein [Embleya sp. NBC_00896]|uniref:TIGR02680 family protein n=1 Tax=Embleya sp. NBC_00896 TaxID=2975961 RepID=UPI0038684979|nr:TIGR02680 family protein [Embleya sp. NBC_00896]